MSQQLADHFVDHRGPARGVFVASEREGADLAGAMAANAMLVEDRGDVLGVRDLGIGDGLEIAADQEMRSQGLMYRDHLADDRGMIFVFPQSGDYAFWMKNTIIPLDMIWIDEGKKVVHVTSDVPPCQADPCPSYPPGAQAMYVLEVAAGVAAKHHVAAGDVLRFEHLDNVKAR